MCVGGGIAITSERDQGTTVTVTTPHRRVKSPETAAAASAPQPPFSLVGSSVLLGEECVHTIEVMPSGYYAAVLMDIQTHVMDGYEATRLIRSMEDPEKNGIPIIAMTANAFAEDRAQAFETRMDDFLAKPLDFTKVAATLKRAILRRPHSFK